MSTPTQQVPHLATTPERRFYPRIVPQTPIFFAFSENESEASLLLNVSENGLLASTPKDLPSNSVARLSVPLNGLPKPVQVIARVAWANEARKLAGIQFLDLSEHDRQQIRKWGACESTQSRPPKLDRPQLIALPSTSSSETPRTASQFPEDVPFTTPRDLVPFAPPLIVSTGPASTGARRAMRAALVATICLATAVILIKAAPGNPFRRSNYIRPESTAAAPPAEKTQPNLHPQKNSNLPSATQAATRIPTSAAATSRRAPTSDASAHHDSAKTVEPRGEATGDQNPADTQSELSPTAALPASTEAAAASTIASPQSSALDEVPIEAATEAETQPSPHASTPEQPLPNPTHAADVPADTSPISLATSHASPIVAPTRSASSPKSAAPVIHMDPPRNQIFEVHLPSGYQASYLRLPGEHVLESPSITVRIQRSVLLPATHAEWPFHRIKKVVVGELVSRVDPQAAQFPTAPANSVRVKATVAKDGHLENVKLVLGPANLLPGVRKALRDWRYQPTLVDGHQVETQCDVLFQFHTPSYRAAKR
jgi:PilZ domain